MGGGGFLATPEQFRIEWNEGEPVNVNLSGKWKYAQGVSDEDFRKMLLNPNNIHSLLYNAMIHPPRFVRDSFDKIAEIVSRCETMR